ncbi:MAG: DUF2510 domain-containing protein [Candidatus Nanopelagicales bacterium]|nr:DUF2510 domain-containing protein [Candidatus Nanopelagicales bacterium]MDZ4250385.1 DUF2510 domain-containing protein [Candidatus Nanopelagicales bacterium]
MRRILGPLVLLLVGLIILVVSLVFGVSGAVGKISAMLEPSASWTAPGSASASLSPGTWSVYEYVGRASGFDSSSGSSGSSARSSVDWSDVTVTGPAGPVRTVCDSCGAFTQTLTIGNKEYVGILSFEVVEAGEFEVDVAGDSAEMILSPSVTSVFPGALPPFFAAGLGFLVAAIGAIWLLVRVLSKDKKGSPPPGLTTPGGAQITSAADLGSTTAQTPMAALPGWYADPNVPGQLRWWNGFTWTQDTHNR